MRNSRFFNFWHRNTKTNLSTIKGIHYETFIVSHKLWVINYDSSNISYQLGLIFFVWTLGVSCHSKDAFFVGEYDARKKFQIRSNNLVVLGLCIPIIWIQWNGFHWSDHVTSDVQHLVKYGRNNVLSKNELTTHQSMRNCIISLSVWFFDTLSCVY